MPAVAWLLQDSPAIYGAHRATLDLVRGLAAAGDRPRVFLLEELRLGLTDSPLHRGLAEAGATVETLPVRGAFSPSAARALRARLRALGIPVLHTLGPKADLHGWLAAGRTVRQVSTVHGWLFRADCKERLHEAVNRWTLRRCRRVICLSRHYEELLLRAGVRRERLVRIPSGLDMREFAPPPEDPPEFIAGWMGRCSEEKRGDLLLRILARAAPALPPGARVLFAGEGPCLPAWQALAGELGLADRLVWRGYCPRAEFFARVGALVVTSRMENLPYAILEAMAAGRPVLAGAVGGIPDLVEHERTGFLVPPEAEETFAARLVELAGDPARGRALGSAGRNKLEREFSWAGMVERTRTLYADLVAEGSDR
jgi:glycosyltransferase involved in cell wall biosynthesis